MKLFRQDPVNGLNLRSKDEVYIIRRKNFLKLVTFNMGFIQFPSCNGTNEDWIKVDGLFQIKSDHLLLWLLGAIKSQSEHCHYHKPAQCKKNLEE